MFNGILFSNKRTQYAICRAMNGPRDCQTDGVCQEEKNKYCMLLLLSHSSCVWALRPRELTPTRLLCPWDSLGKNNAVGCHFLLQLMEVKSENEVAQSCQTLSDPMDCSPPGSSIHGIFQGRVLEWADISFSTCVLHTHTHTHTHTHYTCTHMCTIHTYTHVYYTYMQIHT